MVTQGPAGPVPTLCPLLLLKLLGRVIWAPGLGGQARACSCHGAVTVFPEPPPAVAFKQVPGKMEMKSLPCVCTGPGALLPVQGMWQKR